MKNLAILGLIVFLQGAAWAQPTGQGTQGPIQYAPSCSLSLRYGNMAVCYDTTLQAWYYWSYQARGGRGQFVPSSISNRTVNFLSYGVCDGSTDQTANLQTALTAAGLAAGPATGQLNIPASCNATTPMVVNGNVVLPENISVVGLGGSCVVGDPCVQIKCGNTSGACLTSTSTHGTGVINISLVGTASGGSGLKLDGTFHFNVSGNAISGFTNNGLWLTNTNSSAIYNYTVNNNISNNGTNLFLDGTANSAKTVGANTFANDQFTSASGTNNVVATSFTNTVGAAGYQNVYQNDFANTDISHGNGSATVGFVSNGTLNTTFENVTAENLNTIFVLNQGTTDFDVRGGEGAILTTSGTGVFTKTGDDTYNICLGYIAGTGGSECYSTMPKSEQYVEPAEMQDPTGLIGWGLRQNFVTHSEDFTNASWTTSGVASVANTATSPGGAANAASVLTLTGGVSAFVQASYSLGSSIANTCWTGSVYEETASSTARPQMTLYDSNGTLLTLGAISSQLATNGYTRYYVTGCASGSDVATGIRFRPMYFSGAAPSATINLFGAQLSETNGPIRYVRTVGSIVNDGTYGITAANINNASVNNVINAAAAPYNAVGDGTTDNTAAFTAALAAVGASGTLLIPPGTYEWNTASALALTKANCNVTIAGDSRGGTFLEPTFSSGDAISFKDTAAENPTLCGGGVRDLQFTAPGSVPTSLKLIHVVNLQNITIRNVTANGFTGSGDATIYIDPGAGPGGTTWTEDTRIINLNSYYSNYMLVFDGKSESSTSLNNTMLTNSHCDVAGTGACVLYENMANAGIVMNSHLQFNADLTTSGASVFRSDASATNDNGVEYHVQAQYVPGSGDGNCFDAQSGTWTYPGWVTCSGLFVQSTNSVPVINTLTGSATLTSTPNLFITPVAVGSLPGTCTAGTTRIVNDWNGTNGTCTGSGGDSTTAVCGASNTWYCP